MKTVLTMALIKRLKLESKPIGIDGKGELVFDPNAPGKDYIVHDSGFAKRRRAGGGEG